MKGKTNGAWSNKNKLEDIFRNSESELKPFHVRLESIQLELIEDISENYGLSKAEVTRRLLREGLKQVAGVEE
jgi:hypothetical protein